MRIAILSCLLLFAFQGWTQCAVQTGQAPGNDYFNTGSDGKGRTVAPGGADLHWQVARDSINGVYQPALIMSAVPAVYYRSPWSDCAWISFSATGEHTADRFFFFRISFELPCFTPCGKNFNDDNSFCLSLDMFADNSIYEIYVNGVPQSSRLQQQIPVLPNPYKAEGAKENGKLFASLCSNWKAGTNTLIIQVASSATVVALLSQASVTPLPPIHTKLSATICEGQTYTYHSKQLTKTGLYLDTLRAMSGCDSVTALDLTVTPSLLTRFPQTICEGSSYLGYSKTGTYTDTFRSVTGCDSIRVIQLSVVRLPIPVMPAEAVVCDGDSILLSPGVFTSYLWQDGSVLDHLTVTRPGIYRVTVTNACGIGKSTIHVTDQYCGIYFPSAFTPNKDGKNDQFRMLSSYSFSKFYLCVYNRWGQLIFESTLPDKGWDGTYQHQLQQTGTYIWYCRYTRNGTTKEQKGNIVLLR